MPSISAAKRKKAFRLRLKHLPLDQVASESALSIRTVRKLENGWTDRKGVKHPGWRQKLDELWKEEERAELECGHALKKERVKV